jgi:NAD(P)-dependent dehydrogenase (short-subunit alcohol dehydrogenase family)
MKLRHRITLVTFTTYLLPFTAAEPNAIFKFFAWCGSIGSDLTFNLRNADRLDGALNKAHNSLSGEQRLGIVTGSCGGVGSHLCRKLSSIGFRLGMFSRKEKESELRALADDLDQPNNLLLPVDFAVKYNETHGDLFRSLSESASLIKKKFGGSIDLIIHNAGLMSKRSSVSDIYTVNYISPTVLSLLLLPDLMKSQCSDPVLLFVSSSSHLRGRNRLWSLSSLCRNPNPFAVLGAYADSKLKLLLASAALRRRFKDTGLVVRSVHPGLVDTPMLRGFFGTALSVLPILRRALRSPSEGAAAVLLAAFHRERNVEDFNKNNKEEEEKDE